MKSATPSKRTFPGADTEPRMPNSSELLSGKSALGAVIEWNKEHPLFLGNLPPDFLSPLSGPIGQNSITFPAIDEEAMKKIYSGFGIAGEELGKLSEFFSRTTRAVERTAEAFSTLGARLSSPEMREFEAWLEERGITKLAKLLWGMLHLQCPCRLIDGATLRLTTEEVTLVKMLSDDEASPILGFVMITKSGNTWRIYLDRVFCDQTPVDVIISYVRARIWVGE